MSPKSRCCTTTFRGLGRREIDGAPSDLCAKSSDCRAVRALDVALGDWAAPEPVGLLKSVRAHRSRVRGPWEGRMSRVGRRSRVGGLWSLFGFLRCCSPVSAGKSRWTHGHMHPKPRCRPTVFKGCVYRPIDVLSSMQTEKKKIGIPLKVRRTHNFLSTIPTKKHRPPFFFGRSHSWL